MNGAQITISVMYGILFGIAIALHGKPRYAKHNAFITGIAIVINVAILYWGNFWN